MTFKQGVVELVNDSCQIYDEVECSPRYCSILFNTSIETNLKRNAMSKMHVLTDSGNWALLSIFKADLIVAHKVLHFDDLLTISV